MTKTQNLVYTRGDSRTLRLKVTDSANQPVNLTGAKVWFTVKKAANDPDSQAIITRRTANANGADSQVLVTNGLAGQAEIYLDASIGWRKEGTYVYDIQVKTALGRIYTVVQGKIQILGDVTHATG